MIMVATPLSFVRRCAGYKGIQLQLKLVVKTTRSLNSKCSKHGAKEYESWAKEQGDEEACPGYSVVSSGVVLVINLRKEIMIVCVFSDWTVFCMCISFRCRRSG